MADRATTLPLDSKDRLNYPVSDGALAYFPAAIAGVAYHSFMAGAKYNDGALLHKRWLSPNHIGCVERHAMDLRDFLAAQERGIKTVLMWVYNFTLKTEELKEVPIEDAIINECNALSWRALATSQIQHERLRGCPLAPAAVNKPEEKMIEMVKDTIKPARVKVLTYHDDRKISIIKAIRQISGYSLKEAKDLSELNNGTNFEVPINGVLTVEEASKILRLAGAIL
jgi:ribosomal protein L7/L12